MSETTSNITHCIPHHFALNPDKLDKIRVVTAKYQNVSLNANLLKGPDLLKNLVSILIKFRKEKYAVSVDIEKMFHQVKVRG